MRLQMSGDSSTTGPYALSRTYEPRPGAIDELLDANGQLHPRWRTFFGQVEPLGRFELEQRWDKARHLLHENGVSYNVYGDPHGQDRRSFFTW